MSQQNSANLQLAKDLAQDGLALTKLIKNYAQPIAHHSLGGKKVTAKQTPLHQLIKTHQLDMDLKYKDTIGKLQPRDRSVTKSKGCCENRIPIVITDEQSFEILEPGYYYLTQNETFSPLGAYPAINIIATENVTVDFCGYTLTQGNTEPGVIGILFDDIPTIQDYHNIKITNGSIRDFTEVGIFFFTLSPFTGAPSTELTVTDMNVLDCGSVNSAWPVSGILFMTVAFFQGGFDAVGVQNVVIRNCKVNRSVGNGGLLVGVGQNILIQDTEILDTTDGGEVGDGNIVAVTTIGNNITIERVHSNGLRAVEDVPGFADAFDCYFSTDITVRDSTFNDTRGGNGSPIFMFANERVQIFNVMANNAVSTIAGVGNFIDRCNNVYCENSQFCDLVALDASGGNFQCAGAFIQGAAAGNIFPDRTAGQNCKFVNCKFNNIYGETSNIIQGVNNSQGYNQVFEGCQFNNNRGGISSGLVCGLHVSDTAFQTTAADGYKYINCQFNDHVKDAGQSSLVAGFISITKRNLLFDSCEAINITHNGNDENLTSGAYGLLPIISLNDPLPVGGNVRNVKFRNCVVSDIRGLQDVIGYSVGGGTEVIRVPELGVGEVFNMTVENCVAERITSASSDRIVAGIAESYSISGSREDFLSAKLVNLYVTGNKVVDVKSTSDVPSPKSAGIYIESVQNPIVQNNLVNDCDRGILFTGTNKASKNGFRLALTPEDALADPPVYVALGAQPPASTQTFTNQAVSDTVNANEGIQDFLIATTDIPTDWETGQPIEYTGFTGEPFPGLSPGQTYYLIVYRPGFTECGLVKDNDVTNCQVSGYQDDRKSTESAWVSNTAFNNGTSHRDNYRIHWGCKKPVSEGSLGCYPETSKKAYNLSIVKKSKYDCRPRRHHCRKC